MSVSKSVGIEEARKILGDLATAAQYGHSTTLTRNGKPIARIVPIEEPAVEHYTAWLTTDPTCLDQPNADVAVLRDELRGEPDDHDAWTSAAEDPVFTAITDVNAEEGDEQDAIREAVKLLEAAGWELDGDWRAAGTGSGYLVTVARA